MLIRYSPKVEHLKCVTLTPKEGLKLERSMVCLLPGTNEVTDDEWKAMRGNINTEYKSGEIKPLAQSLKERNLKDMPPSVAVKFVAECTNPDTLNKWNREVTNEEVRLAITKRFQKLKIEPSEEETADSSESITQEKPAEQNDSDGIEPSEEENKKPSEKDSDSEFGDVDFDSPDRLENKTVAELTAICKEKGIDTKNLSKKADLLEAINKAGV